MEVGGFVGGDRGEDGVQTVHNADVILALLTQNKELEGFYH